MTAAFIALAALGLAAVLVSVWLLVAGERRRVAATFLVSGLILVIGAFVIVRLAERDYDDCRREIELRSNGLPPLPSLDGRPPPDPCESKLVLDGEIF